MALSMQPFKVAWLHIDEAATKVEEVNAKVQVHPLLQYVKLSITVTKV